MTLYDAVRTELLTMRKRADGVTVGALAHADTVRQLLGGGDPRVAYNALMHILIEGGGDLPFEALSHSLGYASEGPTHLARLQDFGRHKGYDQRQARRYSDRGVDQLARAIATEWTIEGSPTLTILVLRADDEAFELALSTHHLPAVEMTDPIVEAVLLDATRTTVGCEWSPVPHDELVHQTASVSIGPSLAEAAATSIRWQGELWPRFVVTDARTQIGEPLRIESLGSRLQVSTQIDQFWPPGRTGYVPGPTDLTKSPSRVNIGNAGIGPLRGSGDGGSLC